MRHGGRLSVGALGYPPRMLRPFLRPYSPFYGRRTRCFSFRIDYISLCMSRPGVSAAITPGLLLAPAAPPVVMCACEEDHPTHERQQETSSGVLLTMLVVGLLLGAPLRKASRPARSYRPGASSAGTPRQGLRQRRCAPEIRAPSFYMKSSQLSSSLHLSPRAHCRTEAWRPRCWHTICSSYGKACWQWSMGRWPWHAANHDAR